MSLPRNPVADPFLEKVYNRDYRPLIMGIINVAPDSFYFPSSVQGADALRRGLSLMSEGADILDIGGESSRPGSQYVSAQEEMDRVVPLVAAIRRESDVPISVDTRKYAVAKAAVSAGASCINDISALRDDTELGSFIASHNLPIILMHMQGSPQNMQDNPNYHNVVQEVKNFLQQRIDHALSLGIPCERIIVDPGIGFGKGFSHNLQLLGQLGQIVEMGFPVLIGHSRKSFIGKMLAHVDMAGTSKNDPPCDHIRQVEQRLYGSLGIVADSYMRGARIFRVHDVAETRDMLETMHRIRISVE